MARREGAGEQGWPEALGASCGRCLPEGVGGGGNAGDAGLMQAPLVYARVGVCFMRPLESSARLRQ